MSELFLPSWEEAEKAVIYETQDPLQWFIFRWEPAGQEEIEDFRNDLKKLMDYIKGSK